jgi:hypothetical protein
MKASGKTTRRAPLRPASAISFKALASVASRSRNTGEACTAAILKVDTIVCSFPFSNFSLHRYDDTWLASVHP